MLAEIDSSPQAPAYFNQHPVARGLNPEIGEQFDLGFNFKLPEQIADEGHIEFDQFFKPGPVGRFDKRQMIVEIRRSGVCAFKALQMFDGPAKLMANPDFIDPLQTQSLFPYRDGQPQGSLVIFKAIAARPGGAPGKLDAIENNKNIR